MHTNINSENFHLSSASELVDQPAGLVCASYDGHTGILTKHNGIRAKTNKRIRQRYATTHERVT